MLKLSQSASKAQGHVAAKVQLKRANLVAKLTEANGLLTILSAPAGFGKTTVLTQAFRQLEDKGLRVAWLDASTTDNDLSRFLNRLDGIVQQLGLGRTGIDSITALTQTDQPYALFFDELENIKERSVLALIQEVSSYLPSCCYIFIATRRIPALGLPSLRARGRLLEIGTSELRFEPCEAEEMFAPTLAAGLLNTDDVQQLHFKSEGWPAVLSLASLAMKQGKPQDFIARFSGTTDTIAQYLADAVFDDQPEAVQSFLLNISILTKFDIPACNALTSETDTEQMIQYLLAQNLIIPVEPREAIWRFHSLFAEYLRHQLRTRFPDKYFDAHAAASQWHEQQSQYVLAIEHALEGQYFERVVLLLNKHAEALLQQGRIRLLSRWFSAIPQFLVAAHPLLYMLSIWATAFTQGAHQAAFKLEAIDWENSSDVQVRNHGSALHPTLLGMQDRCEEALNVGMAALEKMDTGNDFASATLLNAIAHQILIIGNPRDAQRMIDAARRLHGGESSFNKMYSETTEGLIDMLHGRLRHASARFRLALDVTDSIGKKHIYGNAWAGVLYTATTYESNDLHQTRRLLNVYLPLAREVGIPDHLILIYLLKCRLAFIERDLVTALRAVTDLEYLGHSRKIPRAVAAAQLERAKIYLIQGNALASQDELFRAEDPEIWARECRQRLLAHDIHYLRLAKLRWEIHFGDPVAALHELNRDLQVARSSARLHRALVLQLLRVLALHRTNNAMAAKLELEDCLKFAAQEGYVRTVLDEGPSLGKAVWHLKQEYDTRDDQDPHLADYLNKLLQLYGPLRHDKGETVTPALSGIALTRKEIEVIRLLTEGCSNLDLAARLHVSNSTVRTHLRNINTKLGTNSRTQAIAAARRLCLLH
ncbi:LuxR C-terminal-related transcriptional regulator [Stutzerimonas chloritidismutans]|uniref:LuxR C-terminal-related transcriptional regulator n=1 Tax=Stutzerimonas chloritidismutans TaxID=203192 RepID=UPI003F13EA2C